MHPNCASVMDIVTNGEGQKFGYWNSEKEVVSGIEGEFTEGWVTPGLRIKLSSLKLIQNY